MFNAHSKILVQIQHLSTDVDIATVLQIYSTLTFTYSFAVANAHVSGGFKNSERGFHWW